MPSASADISVIVCAYTSDRWNELMAAISALKGQSVTPSEIIVVIDHNPALFDRVTREVNGVTVLENPGARGLSEARNVGIAAAGGDIVAFVDDDAVAEDDWIERLVASYTDPLILGVGGTIDPNWLGKHPAWFPDEFAWVVGCTYLGMPTQIEQVRNLIGCNMSFRHEVFDQIGGFRSEIGRVGTLPVGCEETELCIRLHQQCPLGVLLYDPAIRVRHSVPKTRSNWRYYLRRCYAEGISKALISHLVGASASLASERVYTFHTLPQGVWRGLTDFVHGDISGLARAVAIGVGLTFTVMGYVIGML